MFKLIIHSLNENNDLVFQNQIFISILNKKSIRLKIIFFRLILPFIKIFKYHHMKEQSLIIIH
jgi:hypothetical protein